MTTEKDGEVDVALVGKYDLEDAYMSIHESLKHAGFELGVDVNVHWVHADGMAENYDDQLEDVDGVIVPGGFGMRGAEGRFARSSTPAKRRSLPRALSGLPDGRRRVREERPRSRGAHSAEMDEETPHPVIDILPEQYEVEDMGTMRLGGHTTVIEPETLAYDLYEDTSCSERHRHRYEVNPEYFEQFEDEPLVFSGTAGNRMEILELEDHPYFLGTQFHPEYTSRPGQPSPPFLGLVEAVLERATNDEHDADTGADTETEVTH